MLRRLTATFLVLLTTFATTAQQGVGIVSTVANLVDIVEGRNTAPVQINQPVVEGAAYRATGHSAAEFTFPGGLRAAAGPSSSVAFHPSPAGAGTRLVSVSEGLFKFALPTQGSRIDVQTPNGAIRLVGAAPNTEVVVKVNADGTVKVATTSGRAEIRDYSSGALLLLLDNGQSATLGVRAASANPGGAPLGFAVLATGPIDPETGAQIADLNGLLAGQYAGTPPPSGGAAAGDAAAQGSSDGALLGWGLAGAGLIGGVIAAATLGGGGSGHHGGATTTTTTTGQ